MIRGKHGKVIIPIGKELENDKAMIHWIQYIESVRFMASLL